MTNKQEIIISQIDAVVASLNEHHSRDLDTITGQLALVHDAIRGLVAA